MAAKIIIFSSEFPPGPGGIGTHAHQLARHLTRLGWRVLVLSLQDYAEQAEIHAFNQRQPFQIVRLQHLPFAPLEALYRLFMLYNWVRRWSPDIVLASGEHAAWLAALFPRLSRIPWAAVWHGFAPTSARKRALTRWSYSQFDAVVSVSQYSLRCMLDLGIRSSQRFVVTNGADPDAFYPLQDERVASLRTRYPRILLTVGNVTDRKGQDIVIQAMPRLLKEIPGVHYLVAGLPTQQAEMEGIAAELGVEPHVHFLGRVDTPALLALYNACDVFVLTSRHDQAGEFEGYGIVVVEAALCGKPAVVSNNSGLVEAIAPGETGLAVNEDDPSDTARALLDLLRDDALRSRMGEAARSRALREQTWEACAAQYDRILAQVAGQAAGSTGSSATMASENLVAEELDPER
jgi:phosphatidylinositol alpha-1,6-mannosyltransferase